MRRVLHTLLLCGLSGALVLGAPQQAADQRPTISVETNLVMLPVTVLDKRGEFVPGLTEDRFVVYDNGEPQPIQAFTSEEIPATVGIVVDSSASMRAHRDAVTAAATAFAASAHPLDELFSVNFNEHVWPGLPTGVVFARSVDELHRALARAPAAGMTALYDALDRALDHLQFGTRERKALIVVSDGGDNASVQTLAHIVERARRSDAVIYAITLVDENALREARPGALKKLATETGGDVFAPRRVEDVMDAFAHIGREIRFGYMLGYSPPGEEHGEFRSTRVVVTAADGRRLNARTRAGYYAGRSGTNN